MKTHTKKRKRIRELPGYSARLTSKFQATIPREIREFLHLEKGDEVLYELMPDNTVTVRKITPLDTSYLQALNSTLTEWESEEDEQAYKNL